MFVDSSQQIAAAPASDKKLQIRIFWVAFLVRVAYILLAHTYKIRLTDDHFEFGWEMGRIGRALATGHGYSDPFTGHTGPSAWTPPLYTYLVGGVFKVFGVYSRLSAFVLLTFNSLLSAYTAVLCYEIGLRCFGRKCAVWSGWMWALYPAALQYAVRWVWEMSATAALFAGILLLTLRLRDEQTVRRWAFFGLLWGLLALTNPTPLLMMPFCLLYLARGIKIRQVVLAGVVFMAVLAPWSARNYLVFHRFIPLRDNFGAENFEGNSDWSVGFPWGRTVPLENRQVIAYYARVGEPEFSAERGRTATAWIHEHPLRFVELSIKRAWMYWAGVPKSVQEAGVLEYGRLMSFQFLSLCGLLGAILAASCRRRGWFLFVCSMVLLPLPYYLVTVQARFRHVLEPLICVLGVYLFQSADRTRVWSYFGKRTAGIGG